VWIAILAGCAVGPDYVRPTVETPPDWRWKPAEPRDHLPRGAWWEVFADTNLNRLQDLALGNNLELQAALARVDQARSQARVSRADFFPSVNASAQWQRSRTSGNSPSPVPQFDIPSFYQSQWSVPLDLSYELDLWGKVRRGFEASRAQAVGAEAARQAVLLALQADVAAAYFTLQTLDRQVDLLTQTIDLRRQALEVFEQRLRAGMGSEFEVQRARVEVATAEADLQLLRRRRAESLNLLALLCGRPSAGFEPVITSGLPTLPEIVPGLPAALLERRPDIAQAERELAARSAQIGVARAAFFPAVRLTAAGGYLSGELEDLFRWDSHTWMLNPSISVPLFAGGRNRATLERARAAYEEAVSLYRQRILVAFKEVEDSLSALTFLRQEAAARRQAAEAARLATRLAFERYRSGSVNFLEVVDSESARLLNELAHERALQEQILTTVRLAKALGGGWE
jgi:multidrug efflux system outer membrane protein